jgi:hypothetical protein
MNVVMKSTTFWDMTKSFAFFLLHTDFLLDLIFYLEVGGEIFLRNIGSLSTEHRTLHLVRLSSQVLYLCEHITENAIKTPEGFEPGIPVLECSRRYAR